MIRTLLQFISLSLLLFCFPLGAAAETTASVPRYPGAVEETGYEIGTVTHQVLVTPDSIDAVKKFYSEAHEGWKVHSDWRSGRRSFRTTEPTDTLRGFSVTLSETDGQTKMIIRIERKQ